MKTRHLFISAFLSIICVMLASCGWQALSRKNVGRESKLYIPKGATIDQVMDSVGTLVDDIRSFKKAAEKKGYKKIYPGRYTLRKEETNASIIDRLMKGQQDEIEIMIGNYSSVYELATKLDPFLEIGTDDIIKAIAKRPEAQGLDTLQMIYFLAPNTYRLHWTSSADELVEKIAAPYKKFWTEERRALQLQSGFTEMQVISLASIVQLESYKPDEQPRVAGLYLNRIRKHIKLDADPTVIFAKKAKEGWDKKIQRVYYKDLAIASPYNTYRNTGIPPGPICMPNPSAIDAVLKPEQHTYIYFVADPSRPGYHNYATTGEEHEKNAQIYREWADKNKVK